MRRAKTASGSSTIRVSRSWLGCIHTSQPARSAIVGASPQWSEWAWVHTTSLASSQPQVAHGERPLEVRERVGTVHAGVEQHEPSPADTAQALQCGTPGQGSGRRRRKTPGSTRSPRPSSRLLSHLGHLAETRLRRLQRRKGGGAWPMRRARARRARRCRRWPRTCSSSRAPRKRISGSKAEAVARRYFAAIDARDLDAAVSMWAPGGRENVRGRVDVLAPGGRARVHRRADRRRYPT